MDPVTATVLYKIASLLAGTAFAVLGAQLFRIGVYERATDLRAVWGDKRLILKQAAPGTIFALFGASVIAMTVYRGLEITNVASGFHAAASKGLDLQASFAETDKALALEPVLAKLKRGSELTPADRDLLESFLEDEVASALRIIAELPADQRPDAGEMHS